MSRSICFGLCVLLMVGLGFPGPVVATTTSAGAQNVIEEIIVSATRRTSNIQDTGAAISAASADELQVRSVQQFADIGEFTPGIHIATYQGDASIFIRGIGTPTIIAGNDSSTATYVDGVFYARAAAIAPAFFDVRSVEVLRGPQGTLYGRNATGGAVNIVTNKPTEQWEGYANVSLGNYDSRTYRLAAGGPVTDRIGVRLAVQGQERDGFTDVVRADGSVDEVESLDNHTIRAHLVWDVTDVLSLSVIGDYYRSDESSGAFHFASRGYADEYADWYSTREGAQTAAYFAYRAPGRVSPRASRTLFSDADYDSQSDIQGVTTRLDWAAPGVDVALIAGYKRTNPRLRSELDSSDAFVTTYSREEEHWQRSLDLQFTSGAEGAFSWIAGATWFEEKNVISNNVFGNFWEPVLRQGFADLQTAGVLPPFPIVIPESDLCCDLRLSGEQDTEAWAVYFDTTYQINERWRLHFGGRHSSEERDGRQLFDLLYGGQRFAPNTLFFPNAVSDARDAIPDPLGLVVGPVRGPAKFDAFTPKLAVDVQLSDDLFLYALVQKGFKTGGYNIGSGQLDAFKPEKIWSYEAGLKSEWFERRLRLNASLFHYEYENLQAQDSVANQPIIRNVGESVVDGLEIEFLARLGLNWQVDGNITWLDAEFTDGELTEPLRPAPLSAAVGSAVTRLDGLRLTRAPEFQGTIGLQYERIIGQGGQLRTRLDYAWQSEIFFTVFNIDAASQESYGVLNAGVSYTNPAETWTISAYGRNLADETYFTNQILTGTVYGAEFVGSLAPPRTYGLGLEYRF